MWAGLVIGVVGCGIYIYSSWMLQRYQIDDPLDASCIHGACGMWGTLALGIFGNDANAAFAGYAGSAAGFHPFRTGEQFAVQVTGVLLIALWTFANSFILFTLINITIGMRVPEAVELRGLDMSEHGGEAYDQIKHLEDEQEDNYDDDKVQVTPVENVSKKDRATRVQSVESDVDKMRVFEDSDEPENHNESFVEIDEEDAAAYRNWDGNRRQSAAFAVEDMHSGRGHSTLFTQGSYDLEELRKTVPSTSNTLEGEDGNKDGNIETTEGDDNAATTETIDAAPAED